MFGKSQKKQVRFGERNRVTQASWFPMCFIYLNDAAAQYQLSAHGRFPTPAIAAVVSPVSSAVAPSSPPLHRL